MSAFRVKCVSLIIMITVLFSCSTIRTAPDEKNLHNRAEKLWEAKVEGDWETIYNMTVESYREKVQLEKFARAPFLNVLSFSIKEIKAEPPEARVMVEYRFAHQSFEFDAIAKDEWVWENGNWFLNMKPMRLPF